MALPIEKNSSDGEDQSDYYANHLAEVDKTNDVVSTEDIFNKSGMLLVRRGARISQEIAQKVVQHKLLKPLEEQVQLERSINPTSIISAFTELAIRYPDVRAIHDKYDFDARLKALVKNQDFGQIVAQKLTVMQERLPARFENAVFVGWLSALIATEMKLGGDLVNAVYLAGLLHDVGLLHISPDIINKTGQLSVEEWRAMQSHVVVAQMLLKNTRGIHPRAATAVMEHHESCDGTGYPAGKMEDQLDVLGQIIATADSLHAIRVSQFEKSGRSLRDAIPYLHMNASVHFTSVYDAVHALIKESGLELSTSNPHGNVEALVSHVLTRGSQLQRVVTALDELQDLMLLSGAGIEGKRLLKVIQPVVRMMRSSGILRDEILEWLKSLQATPDGGALRDLNEMELMQNELYWQVKKAHRMLLEFSAHGGSKIMAGDQERLARIGDELYVAMGVSPAS